jgi:TPR repeat protein/GAF domain-containing protein
MYRLGSRFMAATVEIPRLAFANRRSRVRQKVNVPAYVTFSGAPQGGMLDLYEILNISESGLALHCAQPLQADQIVDMCLELAESKEQISTKARVVWSDAAGRAGFSFTTLADSSLRLLREWLFLNVLATAANSDSPILHHNYTDLLSAVSAVQKEAEGLSGSLNAILALIAARSRSLLRASGAAVALEKAEGETSAEQDTLEMICRASSGTSAPPVGVILQAGSGFSGECVRTGKLSRCDDTEIDDRVDRQSCRALGVRSILAAPLRAGDRVIGLLEVFSSEPCAFREHDGTVLQRFAEIIVAAVTGAARGRDSSARPVPPKPYTAPAGSVLFAHMPEEAKSETSNEQDDDDNTGGIRLPRAHLFLLIAVAATIFLALGFLSAPWIQPWVQAKLRGHDSNGEQTVLASSKPPADTSNLPVSMPTDAASLAQTRAAAEGGDTAAENTLGLLYAAGDEKQGIKRNESDAVHWFTKAAEHGNVAAQSKLGALYWGGRGVPQDSNQAYFWTVLARASGDGSSKVLAPFIATHLTLAERSAIEQQADQWVQQHESTTQASR